MNLSVGFIFFVFFVSIAASRQVSIEKNPGCNIPACSWDNTSVKFIYIRSEGENDCVHLLWSLVEKSGPTLLLLNSNESSSKITFDWPTLLASNSSSAQGAIRLTNEISNSSAAESAVYMLHELLEYNDTKNSADPTDPGNLNVTLKTFSSLKWNVSTENNSSVIMEGTSDDSHDLGSNRSKITLKFTTFRDKGFQTKFPHLFYNERSSSLEFEADNLTTSYPGSRFSVLILASNAGNASYGQGRANGSVYENLKWTIDDEYSPSVFTTAQLLWKKHATFSTTNFWQWRTVCYTRPHRTMDDSSDVQTTSLAPTNSTTNQELTNNTLLLGYFGKSHISSFVFKETFVSFGKPDDGFYRQTNYVSWTSLVGAGEPPSDAFSLMVICIIFAGVGCPVLVILCGGVFMVCRRCRMSRRQRSILQTNYSEIQ